MRNIMDAHALVKTKTDQIGEDEFKLRVLELGHEVKGLSGPTNFLCEDRVLNFCSGSGISYRVSSLGSDRGYSLIANSCRDRKG